MNVKRGESIALAFSIADAANGLAGKRVTWALAKSAGGPRVLRKLSALPGSSADVTILVQTAALIQGTINLLPADFDSLPLERYHASLWIDDGATFLRCATDAGVDVVDILPTVAQGANP